ncbi:MAG: hypothetical protein KAT28_00335 [Candidatus Aenigmarchaeota archaeon]|nr:hypothetical protein [Candidatus Aenigmarchaeota archaeon]
MERHFVGVIIEESLENKDVLKKIKILKTKIEKVTQKHNTPYLKQWTSHTVEILENQADEVAEELSNSIDSKHSNWYADYKNEKIHYFIFRNKIFKVDRYKKEQYDEFVKYGLSLGIPEHQLDFSQDILKR